MILAIDAGNTRIKWGCYADGNWLVHGAVNLAEVTLLREAWHGLPQPEKIMIANVAGAAIDAQLAAELALFRITPRRVIAERERCGVKSNYADPAKLGGDRWAALIAARSLNPGATLVANAGTALTVDALTGAGVFLGGLIVPGVQLMMRSLAQHTAHARAERGAFKDFPANTVDAIYSGALNAALGSIERMAALLETKTHARPGVIISGGSALELMPHLKLTVRHDEHLVLRGLVLLAEATP